MNQVLFNIMMLRSIGKTVRLGFHKQIFIITQIQDK